MYSLVRHIPRGAFWATQTFGVWFYLLMPRFSFLLVSVLHLVNVPPHLACRVVMTYLKVRYLKVVLFLLASNCRRISVVCKSIERGIHNLRGSAITMGVTPSSCLDPWSSDVTSLLGLLAVPIRSERSPALLTFNTNQGTARIFGQQGQCSYYNSEHCLNYLKSAIKICQSLKNGMRFRLEVVMMLWNALVCVNHIILIWNFFFYELHSVNVSNTPDSRWMCLTKSEQKFGFLVVYSM